MAQLYMVIERFKEGDAASVYRRFRDHGRLAPEGLTYVSSWVNRNLERCFQPMETDNPLLLDEDLDIMVECARARVAALGYKVP